MFTEAQRKFLIGVLENLPTLGFFLVFHLSDDLRMAGWVGSILAVLTIGWYRWRGISINPIVLGINVYILVATPLIEFLFSVGLDTWGRFAADHARNGVLVGIFATGMGLSIFSRLGFIGVECGSQMERRKLSFILLLAALLLIPISLSLGDNALLAVGMPIAALIGLRLFLIAGLESDEKSELLAAPIAIQVVHEQEGNLRLHSGDTTFTAV